jgi:type II secretory pathway pseudopilin PulG
MGNPAVIMRVARQLIFFLTIMAIALVSVIVSLSLWSNRQKEIRANAERIASQKAELMTLQRDYNSLTSAVAKSSCPTKTSAEIDSEIARLRAESEILREQINQLAQTPHDPIKLPFTSPPPRTQRPDLFGANAVISDSPSDEYKHELYKLGASSPHFGGFNIDARKDVQNLSEAMCRFAREHDGMFPLSFADTEEYYFKEYRPPHSSDYEIVYSGSINDLTNIPKQAVALVRERQPWPTPSGKLGRLYGMASGFIRIVESDDNFQSWEAEHVIPPR